METLFNPEELLVHGRFDPTRIPALAEMPGVLFTAYSEIPDETGIYIIHEGELVLYVGQTLCFPRRLCKSHQRFYQITSLHPRAVVRLLVVPWWKLDEPEHDPDGSLFKKSIVRFLREVETVCIERFKPVLN